MEVVDVNVVSGSLVDVAVWSWAPLRPIKWARDFFRVAPIAKAIPDAIGSGYSEGAGYRQRVNMRRAMLEGPAFR